jgi:hypothetical protein
VVSFLARVNKGCYGQQRRWEIFKLYKEDSAVKSICLIALPLFLLSAPAPDRKLLAELTNNLIVLSEKAALKASEPSDTLMPKRERDSKHLLAH